MDFATYRDPTTESARAIRDAAKRGATVKDSATGRPESFVVSPYRLKTKPGFNCRVEENPDNIRSVQELALAFSQLPTDDKGCINLDPLRVWEEGEDIFVSNGNRRIAAIWLANEEHGSAISGVRVIKGPKGEAEIDRRVYQSTLNDGKVPSAYEQGRNFLAMRNMGLNASQIGKLVNRSHTHVDNCMGLHDLPESVQSLIRLGKVSDSVASRAYREAQGNEADTLAALDAAMGEAEADGKGKATPKHAKAAAAPKVNVKAEIAALLKYVTATYREEHDCFAIELDAEDWRKILMLLDLDK